MQVVKHQTVMKRHGNTWYGGVIYRQDTDGGEMPATVKVILAPEAYEDLGSPEVLTVTLEGGDKLNPPPPRLKGERASEYAMRLASMEKEFE